MIQLYCSKRMDVITFLGSPLKLTYANSLLEVSFNRFVDFVIVARLKEFSRGIECR